MHLKQGKNCKYVLKTSGLNNASAEFKSERDLDVYIESLLNSDIVINGETAIFSVDHQARAEEILNEIKRDVESSSVKRTIPKRLVTIHNDGDIEIESALETFYQIAVSYRHLRARETGS